VIVAPDDEIAERFLRAAGLVTKIAY